MSYFVTAAKCTKQANGYQTFPQSQNFPQESARPGILLYTINGLQKSPQDSVGLFPKLHQWQHIYFPVLGLGPWWGLPRWKELHIKTHRDLPKHSMGTGSRSYRQASRWPNSISRWRASAQLLGPAFFSEVSEPPNASVGTTLCTRP